MSKKDSAQSSVDEQKALTLDRLAKETKVEQEERRALDQLEHGRQSLVQSMHVKVYSPFRDYFDGQAYSLSAANQTGPFDILPKHHNFISLLTPCQIVIRPAGDSLSNIVHILIDGGVIHVKADEVLVFLNV
ncbi:MAG: hypothetical protein ACREHG_05620 [Candidatus Saccharimonadales bacterium]